MSQRRWRTAFASVVGTSHIKTGTSCQDAGGCTVIEAADGSEVLVAAVADGAGTAPRSEAGAWLAVKRFLEAFGEAARTEPSLGSIDRAFADRWLAAFREAVCRLAEAEDHRVRDYSCTLLGAVIGPSSATYFHIGDGAIVVGTEEPGEYTWVVWPQHGEYANTTHFLTQEDADAVLVFETGPAVDEVALFSDGIERLVLDLSSNTVHSPAFRPIFNWLAGTEPDRSERPSEALVAYLSSDHVNRRTDDDKTIVMATRAIPEAGCG